jgi:hypothetical protein
MNDQPLIIDQRGFKQIHLISPASPYMSSHPFPLNQLLSSLKRSKRSVPRIPLHPGLKIVIVRSLSLPDDLYRLRLDNIYHRLNSRRPLIGQPVSTTIVELFVYTSISDIG